MAPAMPRYHAGVVFTKGLAMRSTPSILALVAASVLGCQVTAFAQGSMPKDGRNWWHGDWQEQYLDGLCEVKVESKRGEYKREIKCKDGLGAKWRGEGKKEFREGGCLVKQDFSREQFKEEVKCPRQ
jgi:hypothetical protein